MLIQPSGTRFTPLAYYLAVMHYAIHEAGSRSQSGYPIALAEIEGPELTVIGKDIQPS